MAAAISLYKTAAQLVRVGGDAVVIAYGPIAGGFIQNPASGANQGIGTPEVLYLDPTGLPAALAVTETTIALQPGGVYFFTPGQTTDITVNAATSGHKFSGIVFQAPTPYPPVPQPGVFPPSGPTTLTETIPAYLYQEYADDDDLQAFFAAFNGLAQGYVTWFATVLLPVYTSPTISGSLLDWVAEGLYGMLRPSLSSGRNRDVGPYNTWAYNTITYNRRKKIGPNDVTVTSDDVFKRIMTWNFYKGDGNVFDVRWLKRRIMRFLIGADGSAPNIDQTYLISVTFGPAAIAIRITVGTRAITGGALYNRFGFNRTTYNGLRTVFIPGPNPLPFESIFKEALDSGVLQMPFQYSVSVLI